MTTIGTLDSIWRYPVKSMRGENLDEVYVAYTGLMGDRIYAVSSSTADPEFPWHTNREHEEFILYQARFKNRRRTLRPEPLEAALKEGLNPPYPPANEFAVEVQAPSGEIMDIESSAFIDHLSGQSDAQLTVLFTQKNMVDCRPVSLFSLQTLDQLSRETSMNLDKRRFRANLYIDWTSGSGFYENELVDRRIRIGEQLEMMIIELDPRCKTITIDPTTAATQPRLLKHVFKNHGGFAGIFAAVLHEGVVKSGDPILLVD